MTATGSSAGPVEMSSIGSVPRPSSMAGMREKNLESAVLFMQTEHASTLKALHEEIQHLQKRCSELTFQLAMETTSSSQEDFYREKCTSLELKCSQQEKSHAEKVEELRQKEEKILKLECKLQSYKEHENKNLMRVRSENKHLRAELDKKADTISTLMTQLHKLKKREIEAARHAQATRASFESRASSHSAGSSEERSGSPATHEPSAPADPPPPQLKPRRHMRGHMQLQSVQQRPPSSRRLDALEPHAPPPDAHVFLHHPAAAAAMSSSIDVSRRDTHTSYQPLPPIRGDSRANNRGYRHHRMPAVERDPSPPSSSPEAEIEVLAVDAVTRNHRPRPAHGSGV